MKKVLPFGVVCSLLAFFSLSAHAAVLDFTSRDDTFDWSPDDWTLGYEFEVISSLKLDALGVFDLGGDGLAGSHQVGIWDSSGSLITSVAVSQASTLTESSVSGLGDFVYESVSGLTLGIGTYRVGAFYSSADGDVTIWDAQGMVNNSSSHISYTHNHWFNQGAFDYPAGSNTNPTDRAYFGPAMIASEVPVPAAAWLFGSALLGLVGIRHRKA